MTAAAWVQAIASIIGGLAAIGALIVAIKAALYAKGQFQAATDSVQEAAAARTDTERQHQEQLRHEEAVRQEESDPYVAVFTRPLMIPGFFYVEFVIKNFGVTAALDVTFFWDKPPRRSFRGNIDPVLFPDRIPFLAPGQEISTLWDDGFKRVQSDLKDEDRHTVQVQYRRRPDGPILSQECVLDWEHYRSLHWVERKSTHSLTNEVEKLRKSFDKFRDGRLKVHTYDGEQQDEMERQRYQDWLDRRRETSSGDAPDAGS